MDELDRAEKLSEQMTDFQIDDIHKESVRLFDQDHIPEERFCVRCGEPIDPARLRIVPGTQYCVKCKSILESHKG